MTSDFLTVRQFCQRGNVGKTRLYELLNEGKIRAKKDGNKTLIPLESYEAWKMSLTDYTGAQAGAQK